MTITTNICQTCTSGANVHAIAHAPMHADIRDRATDANEIIRIAADSAVLEAEAGRPLQTSTEI